MNDKQKIEDGGTAFPNMDKDQGLCCLGMSLRDYFAGQALMGILASGGGVKDGDGEPTTNWDKVARASFNYAKAMIAHRTILQSVGVAKQ